MLSVFSIIMFEQIGCLDEGRRTRGPQVDELLDAWLICTSSGLAANSGAHPLEYAAPKFL